MGSNTLKGYTVGTPTLWALLFWMLLLRHVLPDFSTLISECSSKSCSDAARRFMLLSWWCPFRAKKEHLPTRQFIKVDRLIPLSTPPLFSLDSTFKGLLKRIGFRFSFQGRTPPQPVTKWSVIYFSPLLIMVSDYISRFTFEYLSNSKPVQRHSGFESNVRRKDDDYASASYSHSSYAFHNKIIKGIPYGV